MKARFSEDDTRKKIKKFNYLVPMGQPTIGEAAGAERIEFVVSNESRFDELLGDVQNKATLRYAATAKVKTTINALDKMISNIQRVIIRNKDISQSVKKAFGYTLKNGGSLLDSISDANIILRAWSQYSNEASSAGVTQWQIDNLASKKEELLWAKEAQDQAEEVKKHATALKNELQYKLGEIIYEVSNIGSSVFFESNTELSKEFTELREKKVVKRKPKAEKTNASKPNIHKPSENTPKMSIDKSDEDKNTGNQTVS